MSAEYVLLFSGLVRHSHSAQTLINNEILEITNKIQAFDAIRAKLEQDLLKLQEDELELDDECTSIHRDLEQEDLTLSQWRA